MPLHLDAIMKKTTPEVIAWVFEERLQAINDAFAQKSKDFFLGSAPLVDALSGEEIGKYVFTFRQNRQMQCNEVLDIDLVLTNPIPTQLSLLRRLPQSSASNEYYNAQTDNDQRLIVETVNRYVEEGELQGKIQALYLSAFPFGLTVYPDEDAYCAAFGFSQPIEVGDTGLMVYGLSTEFIAPMEVPEEDEDGETPWTFLAGTVQSLRQVRLDFGQTGYDAVLATLQTAVGLLPVLFGQEVFDTSDLAEGKIVTLRACLKANLISGSYPKA